MVPATGFSGKTRLDTVMSGRVDSIVLMVLVIWLLFSLVSVTCLLASARTDRTWFPVVVGCYLVVVFTGFGYLFVGVGDYC